MLSQNSTRTWIFTALLLLLALFGGVQMRAHRLALALPSPEVPFFLESAMRYREIRFIAEGQALPNPDRRVQWPDGYNPQQDTLVQEYLLGGLARVVRPASLQAFVRGVTPWIYCLIVFPLFWLAYEVTRSRWAAVFGAVLYLTLPTAIDRSTGLVIYRENVMLPLLALHLAALHAHLRRERGSGYAWLSGAAVLLCMLTWKVTTFYQLFVLGYLALLCLWQPPGPRLRSLVFSHALPPLVVSVLLPVSLHFDRYWASSAAALSGALLTLCVVDHFRPERLASRGARVGLLAGLALGLRTVLPGGLSYEHAWDTLLAKLQFLGEKPSDPALLSIHARHYWTGNYRAPTLARAARDFLLPAAVCFMAIRRLGRGRAQTAAGLEPFGRLFLGLALLGSIAGYVMFRKFGTFVGVFAVPLIALGALTTYERAEQKKWLAVFMLASALSTGVLTGWTGMGAEVVVEPSRTDDPDFGVVYSQSSLDALSTWMRQTTRPEDVFLGSWALSPYISTYLDRVIVLNTFFESDMVYRYEDFNRQLFQPLEELHAYCRKYEADYLIYEANFLLRSDPWMSYRYVADHLELNGLEAAYRLHYTPEDTPGFELVYQNDFFRVYRVLTNPTERRLPAPQPYAALFDPHIPGAQPGRPLTDGTRLLYDMLEAGRWAQVGLRLEAAGQRTEAMDAYRAALNASPYHVEAYQHLIRVLNENGQQLLARQLKALALKRLGPAAPLPELPGDSTPPR